MNRITTPILLVASSLLAIALSGIGWSGESDQPPLGIVVEVGTQKIDATLGEPFDATIGGETVRMRVSARVSRRFQNAGIEFEYPRDMAFEYDNSTPGVTIWTLDGSNAVIMVQRYTVPIGGSLAGTVADGMAMQFGRANVRQSKTTIELEGKTIEGVRLSVTLAGLQLRQELFEVPGTKTPTLVILQDSLTDEGETTDEWNRAVEMFSRTFRTAKAAIPR